MSNALLDAALTYAARGWPVHPCRADKTPYAENGVIDATTDPAVIRGWWQAWPRANVAIDVGSAGFMVLDLDPGHDMAALEQAVGKLPNTLLRARTPRGGQHLFFALAEGETVAPSASKLAPKVDVRSFHSYVLVAPSRTADGEYVWESEGKPAYRTDEMVRVANIAREKHRDRDNWLIEPDLPENVDLAIKWLKTDAKIAVEGQGGDLMAYKTAAHLKSFGVSDRLAFDLIWEHWNPRCNPPWTADQIDHLERKVENGYSYNTSPPGNITPAYHVAKSRVLFRPVEQPLPSGREVTSGRFRFVDSDGIEHIRPPTWLIKSFLPSGAYSLIVGEPGTFKSFVALDIALSVATGGAWQEPIWGADEILSKGPVLFAVGEGRPEIKKRIRAWRDTHWEGKAVPGFILGDPVPNVSEDWTPFVEGALALNPDGYKLVVIDTVGRAMQGVNENAQEHASKFTRFVETIQGELGATVLAIHHAGHGENKRARGSSVFGADADTILYATRAGREMLVSLEMTKQKDAQAWDGPRVVSLRQVNLGEDVSSLVAVRPEPTQTKHAENVAAGRRRRGRPAAEDMEGGPVLSVLDAAVVAVLKTNPTREWSQRQLAEAMAMRPEIECGSKSLQNVHLPRLREDKSTFTNRFRLYDPATGRWCLRSQTIPGA